MGGQTVTLTPAVGALGAVVSGVDLGGDLSDATIANLRSALLEHHVLFFHDQHLTPAQQVAFGRRFGELDDYPLVEPLPDEPKIIPVVKEPDERHNFGGGWHTDLIYIPKPPMGSILYAVDVPQDKGDTLFADCHKAYAALSEGMKQLLAGLRCVYNVKHVAGANSERKAGSRGRSMTPRASQETLDTSPAHPVVRTHPESGEKCLYFSRPHTVNFEGMTREESRPLMNWLAEHMTRPEFVTRFRWRPGSVAFWDNRSVLHYALNDYHGERRYMHRLTIAGDVPV